MAGLIAIRDFQSCFNAELQSGRSVLEDQIALDEIDALKLDVDLAGPSLGDAIGTRFRPEPNGADALRLPQLTSMCGPEIRASLERILSTKSEPVAASEADVIKEERMRRVLGALEGMVDVIQTRARQSRPE